MLGLTVDYIAKPLFANGCTLAMLVRALQSDRRLSWPGRRVPPVSVHLYARVRSELHEGRAGIAGP